MIYMDPNSFIQRELERKNSSIELIPSENYCSKNVLEALGSCFQDKYAEGYPGKRYYAGNQIVDEVELLAISNCNKLFGSSYSNVQVHSGSNANAAAFQALLKPGDKLLALALSHGGHLTHGSKFNFSGKTYAASEYYLNKETMMLDYDEIATLASQIKPQLLICGFSSYPRKIDFSKFEKIAKENGSLLLTDISHIAGLIAGGAHESPIGKAQVVTSTTHKTLRGPRGAVVMSTEEFSSKVDKAVFPGLQGGPFINAILAKAVCFDEALQPSFKDYIRQVLENCKTMCKIFQDNGFKVVTGGSDNHLLLLDLSQNGLTGAEAQTLLESCNITSNKNLLPYDLQPPTVCSGLRLGTPAITTRGLKKEEVIELTTLISQILLKKISTDEATNKVSRLAKEFPVYS
ncbi:Serine hydroxymethyltransferase [uncultured archaeon]|nr:Serine hydroxymethyltransferase [uncultured archaeon]